MCNFTATQSVMSFNKNLMYDDGIFISFEAHLSTSDPTCFVPGECQHSILLDESITLGENSCLHFCQKIKGCQWFTYHPENSLCVATADCLKLNSTGNAISGMHNCSDLDNQCLVKGICKGALLTEVLIQQIFQLIRILF